MIVFKSENLGSQLSKSFAFFDVEYNDSGSPILLSVKLNFIFLPVICSVVFITFKTELAFPVAKFAIILSSYDNFYNAFKCPTARSFTCI